MARSRILDLACLIAVCKSVLFFSIKFTCSKTSLVLMTICFCSSEGGIGYSQFKMSSHLQMVNYHLS